MTAVESLIAAMREAAGTKVLHAAEWITLAQEHDGLRAAVRTMFGKRMPRPSKFGQWLSERLGATSGEFRLLGRPRANAWRYCVLTFEEADSIEHARVEKIAAREAKLTAVIEAAEAREAKFIGKRRAATNDYFRKRRAHDGVPFEIKIVDKPAEYATGAPDFTVKVSPDGQVIREPIRGRDGQPLAQKAGSNRSESPESATPKQVNVTERTASDSRLPPWVREGRQPTRQELAAQHGQLFPSRAVSGFADPGGVITANQNAGRSTVHVCIPLSGRW